MKNTEEASVHKVTDHVSSSKQEALTFRGEMSPQSFIWIRRRPGRTIMTERSLKIYYH